MKYALYQTSDGLVIQWQDHDMYGYPPPWEGVALFELPLEFEFPETARWVINGALTAVAPPPPPPPPITAEQVRIDRDYRLTNALIKVLPLQCASMLGQATQAESDLLAEWQEYCMLLGRIEAQPTFPTAVVWPDVPTQ